MFDSVINGGLDLKSAIICIMTSIVLGLIISIVHMKSSRYSKNYIITLAVLPILVSTVMIMVNGNLGTGIAIAGAFSLVRFRSMPGNSKEIMSVFFAMIIGIAIGAGYIVFASLITIVVSLMILVFDLTSFGENKNKYKTLSIVVPETLDYDTVFDEIFNKYVSNYELVRIKTTNLGSLYELKYDITLKSGVGEKEFIDNLRVRNGNLKISIHKTEEGEIL